MRSQHLQDHRLGMHRREIGTGRVNDRLQNEPTVILSPSLRSRINSAKDPLLRRTEKQIPRRLRRLRMTAEAQARPGGGATLSTSSIVVSPSATLIRPLLRSMIIPCSMAFFFNSSADAPTRINSRNSSLISMTS